MYKFLRIQTHSKCPKLQGWYLLVTPNDKGILDFMFQGIAQRNYLACVPDKEYSNTGCPLYTRDPRLNSYARFQDFVSPITLTAKWLETVEGEMLNGRSILINSSGGWIPYKGAIVLATIESDKFKWPEYFEDETIVISRYKGDGVHWYLTSNHGRVFIPSKCNTLKYAKTIAAKHVSSERITVKEM